MQLKGYRDKVKELKNCVKRQDEDNTEAEAQSVIAVRLYYALQYVRVSSVLCLIANVHCGSWQKYRQTKPNGQPKGFSRQVRIYSESADDEVFEVCFGLPQ